MNFLDIKRKLLPTSGYLMGGGGSGGGGSQNVNSTVTNSNIPAYAQPYVEGMLGATQKQIFQGDTDAEGNYNITGFQPYRAFGGDYDEQGNQTAYDPSAGIAGFSPLQTQAQIGMGNLQVPGEYNNALNYTGNAMEQASANNYNPSYYENQYQAPNNLGYNAQGAYAANAGIANMADSQGYNASTYGGANAGLAERFNGENANAAQLGAAPMGQYQQFGGPRDVNAERVNTGSFTNQGTAGSYMSPYMQNVVDIQQREAQRAADVASTGRRGEQTRAGAFGGSRAAIMDAEAARNLATQKGDIQAQGQQAAYQQAQQQFNAEQGYGLQAQQANQQTGLSAQQSNQGMDYNTGMQNAQLRQQMGLANQAQQGQYGLQQGQFNQAANAQTSAQRQAAGMGNQQAANQMAQYNAGNQQQAGMQNAALGSQASQFGAGAANQAALTNAQAANQMAQYNAGNQQQANLANQNAANQAAQFGAGQGLTSAQTRAQYGATANQLNEQSRQFGANNRQQNLQTQLQAANQYGQLGNQRLAAQQGILGLQNATGAQQQAYKQQINNQAMQDYANAQQYPMMQLGTMSNMLRGLPMQAQSTQMYTAQPNFMSQAIGATGFAQNYPYGKAPGGAEGGVIRKASGGLASIPQYDVGGSVRNKLENMTPEAIKDYLKESDSPSIKQMAQAILREKMGMAGGGIIAFREGDPIDEQIAQAYNAQRETPRDVAEQRAAAVTGSNRPGIAAPPPRAAAPNPRAITAVPPQGQAQAPASVNPLMDFTKDQKLIDDRQTELTAKRTLADRPQSAFIAEAQAGRKELGLDQNEALATQRANVMAEKASLKDEAEYKRKMTLAKFFLAWGSTPGPTLVAGMKQFEKTIPELLQNTEDEKKARKETDKVIYELDNAVRLEKMGLYNEATALKNKAAELANALQEQVRKSQEAMLKAQQDAAKTTAEIKGRADVAQIGASGQLAVAAEGRAGRVEAAGVRKKDEEKQLSGNLFRLADTQIQEADNKYEASKAVKTGEYYNANRTKEQLERLDKLDEMQKKKLDSANKKLSELNEAHATRIAGLNRKKDIAGREFYGPRYDAMINSGSATTPPPNFVLDNKK